VGATLSGVVSDLASTGLTSLEGVSVYCDECGEFGHTFMTTDANGYYSFSGDIAHGGGVWVSPGYATYLIVHKEGYQDPPGLPRPTLPPPNVPGWREVTIKGDTQFDIQLIRR
jgi:hypothetical protein